MAVVVPAERYEAMERRRDELFAMIDRVHERNKDVPSEVIEAEVRQAVAAVRQQAARSTTACAWSLVTTY
ncbi:MAG: hypothetical protein HYX53_14005 [Chloroflexi bacterium]|nr:hypothetical protein [Chloroflexota bacterium]